jgi:arylsulfatase A-like enzyme
MSRLSRVKDVRTPNIDRIGKEGMLFTAMRANCTVCSPSRAALLTGRYADRVGVPGVIRTQPENSWGYFKPGVPTIADELKKAGYHTGIIGKWHLGLESPNTPNERGFDHFHGFLGDMMDSYTTHLRHGNNYMRLNHEVIEAEGPCHGPLHRLGHRLPARAGQVETRQAFLPLPRLQRPAFSHRAAGGMAGEGQSACATAR